MSLGKEFKEFAVKGNVVDMAVGIIIGGAFSTIAKSLIADVIMPPIGLAMGGVDFNDMFKVLKEGDEIKGPYANLEAATEAGAVTLNWGVFINNVLAFLVVAFVVFMMVKAINKAKREEEEPEAEPTTKACPACKSDVNIEATRCPFCTSEIAA